MTGPTTSRTDPFCQGCTHSQGAPTDADGIRMLQLGWHRCKLQAPQHYFGRNAICSLTPSRHLAIHVIKGTKP
jgi:hypothetical protein